MTPTFPSAASGWTLLPRSYGDLHISNAPMAGGRITIDVTNHKASIQGLPEGIVFHHGHRPSMKELVEQTSRIKKA